MRLRRSKLAKWEDTATCKEQVDKKVEAKAGQEDSAQEEWKREPCGW